MSIYILDLLATAIFAYGGAAIARDRQCAPGAVYILGIATAVGGGTVREWFLQADNLFWIADPVYMLVCVTTISIGYLTFFRLKVAQLPFRLLDSLAIGNFVWIGYTIASGVVPFPPVAAIAGVITGVGGGIIRDILMGFRPKVIKDAFMPFYLAGSVAGLTFAMMIDGVNLSVSRNFSFVVI